MKEFFTRLVGGVILLFFVCLVTFILFKALPGNAYTDQIYLSYQQGNTREYADLKWQKYIQEHALDKPLFYFSVSPDYVDRRASEIPLQSQYNAYVVAAQHYQPREDFYKLWKKLSVIPLDRSVYGKLTSEMKEGISVNALYKDFRALLPADAFTLMTPMLTALENRSEIIPLPQFHWYGAENQFHYWLQRLFSGELMSSKHHQPVISTIWQALIWTLSINIPAFLILFFIGLLLGTMKSLRESIAIQYLEKIFYTFYSMPLFWLCTLALTITINCFPVGSFKLLIGPFYMENVTILSIYSKHILSIYLPVLCIVLHSIIYISRHVEQSVNSVKKSRYVLAARTRGLPSRILLKKHIIPNAIRPIITLIPQLLPGLITGSIIIELIFNIPGMGRLFWDSLLNRDWQIILGLVIFISIVVYLCMWIADALYPKQGQIDAYE